MSNTESPIPEFIEDLYVQADRGDGLEDSKLFRELQERELKSVLASEPGAEFGALTTLTKLVLWGGPISADFQSIANLILAKALIKGKLPEQKKGRPKLLHGVNGTEVAENYLALMANGVGYAEAATSLAEKYNKSERQIMRIVEENRAEVEAMQELGKASALSDEVAEAFSQFKAVRKQLNDHRRRRIDPDFLMAQDQRLIADIDMRIKGFKVATDIK